MPRTYEVVFKRQASERLTYHVRATNKADAEQEAMSLFLGGVDQPASRQELSTTVVTERVRDRDYVPRSQRKRPERGGQVEAVKKKLDKIIKSRKAALPSARKTGGKS